MLRQFTSIFLVFTLLHSESCNCLLSYCKPFELTEQIWNRKTDQLWVIQKNRSEIIVIFELTVEAFCLHLFWHALKSKQSKCDVTWHKNRDFFKLSHREECQNEHFIFQSVLGKVLKIHNHFFTNLVHFTENRFGKFIMTMTICCFSVTFKSKFFFNWII